MISSCNLRLRKPSRGIPRLGKCLEVNFVQLPGRILHCVLTDHYSLLRVFEMYSISNPKHELLTFCGEGGRSSLEASRVSERLGDQRSILHDSTSRRQEVHSYRYLEPNLVTDKHPATMNKVTLRLPLYTIDFLLLAVVRRIGKLVAKTVLYCL